MLDRALGGACLGAYPYTTRAQKELILWLKIKFSFKGCSVGVSKLMVEVAV